jgi:spore germination protein YaaH
MAENSAPTGRVSVGPGVRAGIIGLTALAVVITVGLAWPDGEWQRRGDPLTVSGWAPYWQPEASLASFEANSDLFVDVSVVAYSATAASTVTRYPSLTDEALDTFRRAAADADVQLIATVFDDAPAGAMAAILSDPTTRTAHVAALVDVVRSGEFDGVDLDYETFAFEDDRSTWASTRPNWIAFLGELADQLDAIDADLIVSVPPVYDAGTTDESGYWVYDHEAMGQIVDRIRVMAYDYSTTGSDPGPVAPIEWVRGLVDTLVELVPPEKLDLGIPVYGYDWVVSVAGACPADRAPEDDVMSSARAERTMIERALTPIWDPVAAEMVVDYVDTLTGTDSSGAAVTCTVNRSLHYLDDRAVHERALLAHRNDLHGVALWALGYDDDATWQAIRAARDGIETWPPPPVSAP